MTQEQPTVYCFSLSAAGTKDNANWHLTMSSAPRGEDLKEFQSLDGYIKLDGEPYELQEFVIQVLQGALEHF